MAQLNADSLPAQGLHVVQGELSILLNSMRRTFKWSSQIYQEEEQDVLVKNLTQLKENLNQISSLSEIDLMTVLGSFLEVIRSEETTGPVTELALSSVFKFLCYGLLDPSHESAAVAVESIADAVTHARFVGTDTGNDEVVLMKILQVLRMLVLSPAGILLSNESICEIMQSCFRICFETRLSDLLRKSAEHSLSEMVRLLYSRLPQFPLQETKGSINYKKLKMRTAAYDPARNKKKSRSPKPRPKTLPISRDNHGGSRSNLSIESPTSSAPSDASSSKDGVEIRVEHPITPSAATQTELTSSENVEDSTAQDSLEVLPEQSNENNLSISTELGGPGSQLESPMGDRSFSTVELASPADYVNSQGVRFIPAESYMDEGNRVHIPYGLPCVRELLRFLISLINPHERQNTDAMTHVGLRLLTVAVETSADFIVTVPSLSVLIQDETCRYLFSLLSSEKLSVLAAACRLCFLLFEAMRTRLKFQMEMYVTKLIEIIVHESPKMAFERRLVALEAIAQLCRIPGLVTELYLNYDCDCHASDLFEVLIKQLSKNVNPVSGIFATHLLSLETLLVVVDSIESHCLSRLISQDKEGELQQKPASSGIPSLPPPAARKSRFEMSGEVPTHEQLMAIKHKKKLLISGADHFNVKPGTGIQFLQENGLLSDPLDPKEVAMFLRENPRLDKKMIGEYISNRKNHDVLEAFVRSLDFHAIRIDEALRLYLETFRLPGEAPLISLLMEQFADHWFRSNDQPFANVDAAFTLAYAVIMLNVDQHNNNVKRQNNPMTSEEFKRNLSRVNGGTDFDQSMLEEIYHSIRNEEIVMPAEQTGLVKENYLWKVLLRRGATKDGIFIHAANGLFDHDLFSLSWEPAVSALSAILERASESVVAERVMTAFRKISLVAAHYAMSDVFDHVIVTLVKFTTLLHANTDSTAIQQAINFGNNPKAQLITETLFALVHKHGDVLRDGWKQVVDCMLQFYRLNILPDSLVETIDLLDPSAKIKLVTQETPSQRSETSLLISLYSYIALSDNPSGKGNSPEEQEALRRAKSCVVDCNIEQLIADSKFLQTNALQELIKVLITSIDVADSSANEYAVIFVLELIIRITVQNRDRVTCIWNQVRDHIYSLVMGAAAADRHFVLERSVVGLLSLTGRLMRREDVAPIVLQSLRMLLLLKPNTLSKVSRQVSFGLHELLKTGAANVHTTGDWRVLFTLLECVGAGARPPAIHRSPESAAAEPSGVSDNEFTNREALSDRGYTSDSEIYESRANRTAQAAPPVAVNSVHGSSPELNVAPAGAGGWILVGRQGEIEHMKGKQAPGREYTIVHDRELVQHDALAFVKACESLAFLVRDVAHITPENFESAVQCIRTFVEASLNGGRHTERSDRSLAADRRVRVTSTTGNRRSDGFQRSKSGPASTNSYDGEDSDSEDLPSSYHQVPVQLLDLMHTLHTRAAQIYQWWASEGGDSGAEELEHLSLSLWSRGWCPLLQGIARLCCDSRRQVRTTAITYLQRSLLVPDLQTLSAAEWESCFNTVLFPLLSKLLEHQEPTVSDHASWEETRMRAATLLSKVFLQHLGPLLQSPTFTALWLTLLDFMEKYMRAEHNDLLAEAIPEMMKNLLLVMETAGVFGTTEIEQTQLWNMTWDRIDVFLPGLRQEVSRSRTPVARAQSEVVTEAVESPQERTDEAISTPSTEEQQVKPDAEFSSVPYSEEGQKCNDIVQNLATEQNTPPEVSTASAPADVLYDSTVTHGDLEAPASDNVSPPERSFSVENPLTSCMTDDISSLPIPLPVCDQKRISTSPLWSEELPVGLPIFTPAPVDIIAPEETSMANDVLAIEETTSTSPSTPQHLPLFIASDNLESSFSSISIVPTDVVNEEHES